jgi:hypothetical protein
MSEEIVREYHVSAFRGKPEDVPIADGVDMEGIRLRDADPMFVSLPIAEIGAISGNGLLYDEALVNSIAEQINAKRPGGIFGHLKDEERSTSFPLPAGLWVGAQRYGQTLWAKSYIPPSAARDYVQNLKAVGGEIATSIYGRGKRVEVRNGVHRRENFNLESLDFAPPSRAALGMGAIPHITAELNTEQEPIMADKQQIIAELTLGDIPAVLRDAIVAEASKQNKDAETVAELTSTIAAKDELISELNKQVDGFRMERLNAVIDAKVAELTDWQVAGDEAKAKIAKLRELFRSQIVTRLGDKQTVERVAEIATAAWEDLKPIAEMMRDALAGPPAVVTGSVREMNSAAPKLEDTPENRQAAISQFGIQV